MCLECHTPVPGRRSAAQRARDARQRAERRAFEVELTARDRRAALDEGADRFPANAHVLVEFSIGTLLSFLQKNRFDAADPVHLGLLDPFVPLLKRCLESRFDEVIRLVRGYPTRTAGGEIPSPMGDCFAAPPPK